MKFETISFWESLEKKIQVDVWTNVYGLARTLLAIGTLLTLVFNDASILFRPGVGIPDCPPCQIQTSWFSLFCLFKPNLELARYIGISLLIIVASGWRPRIMGIIHWWISYSFFTSSLLVDGGDQITTILTLLIVPISLTDTRKWHWCKTNISADERKTLVFKMKNILAYSALIVIRIQVAYLYLNASVSKVNVPEWINGTANYYWALDPIMGFPSHLEWLIPFLNNPFLLAFVTWGTLLIEILLFLALMANTGYREFILVTGLIFHFFILILFGLISFFFAMSAALILYLWPYYKEIPLNLLSKYIKPKFLST